MFKAEGVSLDLGSLVSRVGDWDFVLLGLGLGSGLRYWSLER